jgi:hypothetical protein
VPNNPNARRAGATQVVAGNKIQRGTAQAAAIESASLAVKAETAVGTSSGGTSGAVISVAGRTGTVVLVKADVGLGSVDNTADAAKPVSTAQAAADSSVQAAAASDATTKANAAQAYAIQRANHTGTQPLSTLSQSSANTRQVPRWSGSAWVPAFPQDVFNVRDYGAVGDGSTDDTVACQAALTALVAANRGKLYFPTGRYKITAALTLGSHPTVQAQVEGDGKGATTLILAPTTPSAVEALFDFDFTGISDPRPNYATFFNFTIEAGAVACKRLIRIKNDGISSHQYPGSQVQQVHFSCGFANYANTLLEVDGCFNVTIRDCMFIGLVNPFLTTVDCTGTGLLINATSRISVNGLCVGCRFSFLSKGAYIGGVDGSGYADNSEGAYNCEGWTFRDNISVGVQWGYCALKSGSQTPWLTLDNCEVESYRTGSFLLAHNYAYVWIDKCLNLVDGAGQTVFDLTQVSFSMFTKNMVGGTPNRIFSFTGNSGANEIIGNQWNSAATEIYAFGASTSNNRIGKNSTITAAPNFATDAGSNNSFWYLASVTWDPASLITLQQDFVNLTIPTLKAGSRCTLGVPYDLQNMIANVIFTSANTARINVFNSSGGTVDLPSGVWTVEAIT